MASDAIICKIAVPPQLTYRATAALRAKVASSKQDRSQISETTTERPFLWLPLLGGNCCQLSRTDFIALVAKVYMYALAELLTDAGHVAFAAWQPLQ
jgi:hypothetical protein